MANTGEQYLRISAQWPIRAGEADAPYVVCISSVPERNDSTNQELRDILALAEPMLLEATAICLKEGYVILPQLNCRYVPATARIATPSRAASLVHDLAREIATLEYPITGWLVPDGDLDAISAVHDADEHQLDDRYFRSALSSGAVWVSIGDAMIDLICSRGNASRLWSWLRASTSMPPAKIDWDLWDPDE